MKHAKKVIVVFDDASQCHLTQRALERLGITVQVILQGPSVFRTILDNVDSAVEMVLLLCERSYLPLMVANLRSMLSSSGIIVVSHIESESQRMELLLAGADNLLPLHTSAAELAAIQHALRRRAEYFLSYTLETIVTGDEPTISTTHTDSVWILREKGWSMVAPSGAVIDLTFGERQLIELFSASHDGHVSREDFLQTKSGGLQTKRALDSSISRLKRKASLQNVELPIRSVHGRGYIFAGRIIKEEFASGTLTATEEQALLQQQIVSAWQDPETLAVRLGLQFQSRVRLLDGVQDGVELKLYWDGEKPIQMMTLAQLDQAATIKLLERSIQMLCSDMREWQMVYRLHTTVQISLPVTVLFGLLPNLLKILSAFQTEAENMALVLCQIDMKANMAWLKDCDALRALGVKIWLEHDISVPSLQTLSLSTIEGLRFCFPDTEDTVYEQEQYTLTQACRLAAQHGFKTTVGNIRTKEMREVAIQAGATYVQGALLGSPLSRDGLLLGLASIESV